MPHECQPVRTTTILRTSNREHCLGQWIRMPGWPPVGWDRRSEWRRRMENARDRRVYDKEWYGAGDRDVVIHDGKDAAFCRSCRFVRSFIAHLRPLLPTSIILDLFFSHLNIYFPHCLLSFLILLLQRNDPTPQTHSLLHFCGCHRRTEIHAAASVLALLDPTMIFSADV